MRIQLIFKLENFPIREYKMCAQLAMLAQHSLASDFNRMLSDSESDKLDLLDPDPDIAVDSDVTAMI
jgi:hypothetical protein